MMKKLLEVSAIPAKALYQAKKAAARPKAPPPRMRPVLGSPAAFSYMYAHASRRNAMSRVKKSRKKASVDLKVQTSRMVVKMNQPWSRQS